MQLICLSATYPNTPLEVLECLNLPEAMLEDVLSERPIREGAYTSVREMAVLSTCNRLEVYALIREEDGALLDYVHRLYPLPAVRIDPFLRRYEGMAAARHLFRVAAGLDSIALGETQILGQVARALEAGLRMGSARHALSSLFRAAVRTGKRVRSETELGRKPVHVGSLGVALAEVRCGDLRGRTALVIGTGKIGGATIAELRERGVREILLANRRVETSHTAAGAYGGTALPYGELFEGLIAADLVITSTSASVPIIETEMVQAALARRAGRGLAFVDLGMPRNVAPGVRDCAGVQVFDMDDIQAFALSTGASGHMGLARAEVIVAAEVAEYEKLLKIIPFLGELHRKVEQIRRQELDKALRKLNGAGPEVAEQMEIFSQSLVRKILHEPTMHLRSQSEGESLNDYVDALAKLFDLNENPAEAGFPDGDGEGI
jgi:glutamyl-tRNA reductase